MLVAVVTATLSLSSCDGVTSPHSELELARTRWAERGPSDYSMTIQRYCFCGPGITQPATVTVSRGVIVSRVYVATGDTVPAGVADAYGDVASLFAFIQSAIDEGAYKVDVQYDADFGFPRTITIDWNKNAADDEVSVSVTNFAEPLM